MKYLTQQIVSVIVILMFGVTVWLLLHLDVDLAQSIKDVLLVLSGVLAGAFKDVIGYWLGSSHGSTVKTEMLDAIRTERESP
jgi:hypothetical protein